MTFGSDPFGAASAVGVDVYTSAYRISGTIQTRFTRVTEVLNQLSGAHLVVERATISEYADPAATLAAPRALVSVEEILVMVAAELSGEASSEMRVQKRAVMAQLAMASLRVTGRIHVPIGGSPIDGLLNVPDRFIAMTDARIASGAHPELERIAEVIAVRRDQAHVVLVADDEHPDQLLADVLDERTAESWLRGEGYQPG